MLPKIPLQPVCFINSSIISGGNSLYVLKGCSKTRPAISQCPVVVSLPFDFIFIMPYFASGLSVFLTPLMSFMLPKPNFSKFGTFKPPVTCARLHKVLQVKSSPYSKASSIAPIPIESITIIAALFILLLQYHHLSVPSAIPV